MAPLGKELKHPVEPHLWKLATFSCTANVRKGWARKMLDLAIEKGSHIRKESTGGGGAAPGRDFDKGTARLRKACTVGQPTAPVTT
jgi:hypothetical protein